MKPILILLFIISILFAKDAPVGIHGVLWGASSAETQNSAVPAVLNWQSTTPQNMPADLPITAFTSDAKVAGYDAKTTYYFYEDRLFQATIRFDFDYLKSYDFNYNVFVSVDKYYREIRTKTLTFVFDVYALLKEKYGKRQPVFLPLDPKMVLMDTDNYLAQERWNHRYHPSEYYKRILGRAYARWKYPKTEINFAVNIAAADKKFEYTLSFVSTEMRREIKKAVQDQKSQGL